MPDIVLSIPPYIHRKNSTTQMMRGVLWATLPALMAYTFLFGWGTVLQVILCITSALLFEAGCLKIQKKPILSTLKDSSACVTAVLLAFMISPFAPLWQGIVGTFCAVVVAKQSYGGLGQNLFNPAMVGAAVLLVFFPEGWAFFPERSVSNQPWIESYISFIIGFAWILGGFILIYRKMIDWVIPCTTLFGVGCAALLGYLWGFSLETPLVHLLFHTTLFGAFFIATDPVTSARSTLGKCIYGVLLGVLIYIIRLLHDVPDALPFAILIVNAMVPTIDALTQPLPLTQGKKADAK
jgi:Na+-translocating ferredoxin:NAD+ oxidoreductase subunit D